MASEPLTELEHVRETWRPGADGEKTGALTEVTLENSRGVMDEFFKTLQTWIHGTLKIGAVFLGELKSISDSNPRSGLAVNMAPLLAGFCSLQLQKRFQKPWCKMGKCTCCCMRSPSTSEYICHNVGLPVTSWFIDPVSESPSI